MGWYNETIHNILFLSLISKFSFFSLVFFILLFKDFCFVRKDKETGSYYPLAHVILFGHRWPITLLALAKTMTNTFRSQVCSGHHLNQLHSHRKTCFKERVKTNECWNTRGFSRGILPIKKTISIYSDTRKGELEGHFANNIVQVFTSCHPTYRVRNISTKLHKSLRYCNAYLSRLTNSTLWPSWQPLTQLTHIAKPSDVPHVVHLNIRKAQTAKVNVLLHSI